MRAASGSGAALAAVKGVGGRLLSALPALFGVLALTFILMRVLPGDPASFFVSSPTFFLVVFMARIALASLRIAVGVIRSEKDQGGTRHRQA